jgi:DNA-binding NarL/FixJ family response regulator
MMRVLIVDALPVVRRGIKDILADEFPDLQAAEAGDFPAAIHLLAGREWDLVVLDINLPSRSGLEVLAEARRLRPHLPVLILSQYPEEEFAIRSFKLGAAGYLHKSSAADELLAAVKKTLAGEKYVTPGLAEKLAAALGREFERAPHEGLSNRELDVLRWIARGGTIKEVAGGLGLSEKTVGTYRSRIARKLGLRTNVELARYALQHGLAE